ncbi:MAG: hypothetical protein PUE08_05885 [Eubacteriales bacterium]|nr:hypothetical protein [Eubacteriales bacterium]
MNALEKYRRNLLIKSIVIPLFVTALSVAVLCLAAPSIEKSIPNCSGYSQNADTEAVSDE